MSTTIAREPKAKKAEPETPAANTEPNRRRLEEYPVLASALEKLADLRAQEAKTRREISELSGQVQSRRDVMADAAQSLLDSGKLAGDANKGIEERIEERYFNLHVLQRAIAIQTSQVAKARQEANAEAMRTILPQHRKLIAELVRTATALLDALKAEREFRIEWADDFDVKFDGMVIPSAAESWEGSIAQWFAELRSTRDYHDIAPPAKTS